MKKLIYTFFLAFLSIGIQAQVDRSQPKPGPAPKVKLTKPKSFELPNGLKVMVVENHKLPRVTMTLSIDNAPYLEGDKKGVSDILGAMLGKGTGKISKDSFLEEVDYMGADIDFHSSGATASTLSRYFPRVMEMFALATTDPLFSQNEFDKEINRYIDGLKAEEKSVTSNARRVENVLTFGAKHPFGEYVTEESLKKITLKDVQNHYKNYFAPNNAYLVILGDVKFEDAKKLVEKYFSSWKKSNIPNSKYNDPKNVSKTEINFVDMPNAVQSEIAVISAVNLKMTDSDYFAALVANKLFGGDFSSYLNMNLREAHGWTYGANSVLRGNKYVGKFRAGASVRNEVTDSAIVETMKELNRIRTEKVSEEALAVAKANFIGNFVMDSEKPEVIARQALLTKTQNLPDNFYENYIQNINAVTAEQVMKAAQKYFSADNLRILVVGKASDVLAGLEKLPYKINYFDRFGNKTEKPEAKKVDASVSVKSVLDKYIAAVGGDKTREIKTIWMYSEGEVQGMKLGVKSISSAEGKTMNEVTIMGQPLSKSVFDGVSGYEINQGKREDMSAEDIADSKYYALPFPELTLSNKEGISLAGIENFEGKDAYVIVDGKKKHFYDVNSGLKLGESKLIEQQGQSMTQTLIYDDYREINGVKLPYKITMNIGMELVLITNEVKINEGVSDDDFK